MNREPPSCEWRAGGCQGQASQIVRRRKYVTHEGVRTPMCDSCADIHTNASGTHGNGFQADYIATEALPR